MNWINEVFKEFKILDTSKRAIRKFGVVIAIVLGVISVFVYLKLGSFNVLQWLWGIGLLFLMVGFVLPSVLRPIYRFWMLIAFLIGGVVSRIILTALYYLVITPIGLVSRIIGKDILDEKYDKNRESYWIKKNYSGIPIEQYKKMF